jgi:hypothetical protein
MVSRWMGVTLGMGFRVYGLGFRVWGLGNVGIGFWPCWLAGSGIMSVENHGRVGGVGVEGGEAPGGREGRRDGGMEGWRDGYLSEGRTSVGEGRFGGRGYGV